MEAAVLPAFLVSRLGFPTRRRWRFLAAGTGVVTVVLALLGAEPTPAQAGILGSPGPGPSPSPIPGSGGLLGGLGEAISGTAGKLAVTAFDAIVHALFAPIAHFINTQLIGWLVRTSR